MIKGSLLKISTYSISFVLGLVLSSSLSIAQTSKSRRTSVPTTVKRPTSNRAYVTNVTRPGYGSTNENNMFIKFSDCVKDGCGGDLFTDCYREDQETYLNSQMEVCKVHYENASETSKPNFITKLKNQILATCIEANGRRVSGSYCVDIPLSETAEYKRYADCMKNACAPVDGSVGNYVGCFSSKMTTGKSLLETAHASCEQMYSTATEAVQAKIKEQFFNDIAERKKRACESVLKGKLNNTTGECEITVIYSRKPTLDISSIKKVVDASGNPKNDGFAEEEAVKTIKTGDNLLCSYDSFGLTKYFFYDDTLETQYGSWLLGTSKNFGAADISLIMGAGSVAVGALAFLPNNEENDNYADQLKQKQSNVNNATNMLQQFAPTIAGTIKLKTDGEAKKAMVGEVITGKCKIKEGTNSYGDVYKEGDTISIKWKSYE